MMTHQRDIAIREKNELTFEMSKLSSQSQTITNLKQKEIYLLREKKNLESELKGLHQNMKKILEANIVLRKEVANLLTERNVLISQKNSTDETELKLSQLREVIEILKEENLEYAKELDAKNQDLKEINLIMKNSKIDGQKPNNESEINNKRHVDQSQHIESLKQSLAACRMDLDTTLNCKASFEQDLKITKQELVSVTQARDWYQHQIKESQEVRAGKIKEAMAL